MSKAITVRVDEATKRQAEILLDEIGLNMTVYLNASLKALLRERKVPFELTAKKETDEEHHTKNDNISQCCEDENSIKLTFEEFDAFTRMSPEKIRDFIEKRTGGLV